MPHGHVPAFSCCSHASNRKLLRQSPAYVCDRKLATALLHSAVVCMEGPRYLAAAAAAPGKARPRYLALHLYLYIFAKRDAQSATERKRNDTNLVTRHPIHPLIHITCHDHNTVTVRLLLSHLLICCKCCILLSKLRSGSGSGGLAAFSARLCTGDSDTHLTHRHTDNIWPYPYTIPMYSAVYQCCCAMIDGKID